ncbi:hypothetical protein HK103_006690 [Boothiomyces macroporosus]|uniref:PhnB-like domain-containing protein n=1 Tax=Boothiomyces macroporosus TaxID=261099 RepID=A0AAD5UHF1_9FUNG|nr:hypothetical protein HK103_006690 [Boothiomyces macroporosus]
MVKLHPYISFKGNAREAMKFYQGILGGELKITTYKDLNCAQDPKDENLVMHSVLETPSGLGFMASDTPDGMEFKPGKNNFSMSLSGEDEKPLRDYFEKLSAGGKVTVPLAKAMWNDIFGMLVDKFGITWIVNITVKPDDNPRSPKRTKLDASSPKKESASPKKEPGSPKKEAASPKRK